MLQESRMAILTATLLSLMAAQAIASSPFVCGGSSSGAVYNATKTYLGCYQDRSVSILAQAKAITIAMTPQYCANFCGERGYAYGGVEFGT
jgi:xylan 1,4-beta-xylosidase